ncbi:MAG: hypothetical protein ACKOET_15105 [Verrucomicrobiota bacterium]
MAHTPLNVLLESAGLLTGRQLLDWTQAWRAAVENGANESRVAFFARESGMAEDAFLQKLATVLGQPYLELARLTIPPRGPSPGLHQGGLPVHRPARGRGKRRAGGGGQRPL